MVHDELVGSKNNNLYTFEIEIEKSDVPSKEIEIDYSSKIDKELKNEIIRYEMNMIEFPLFTKNKRIGINTSIKYVFDKEENIFLQVKPPHNDTIPNTFDEKVFIGLVRIFRKNNYQKVVYTDYFTLSKESKIDYNTKNLTRIKNSLFKLHETIYAFNNCFYYNPQGKILNEKISTNMFNISIIDFKEAQKSNSETLKYFRNKKIKEIIRIEFSDWFYKNLKTKGFLRFDSDRLLQIEDDIAKSLYIMLTKWRNKRLYIKRPTSFLASRIPLKFNNNNAGYVVKRLIQAFEYLKQIDLIRDFRFNRDEGLKDSYFEIIFDRGHNFDYFSDISAIETGQENFIIEKFFQEKKDNKEIQELHNLLPKIEQSDVAKNKIEEYLLNYDFEKVKRNILYAKQNSTDNYWAFLDKAIKDDWGYSWWQKEQEKLKKQQEAERLKQKRLEYERKIKKFKEKIREKALNNLSKMSDEEYEILLEKEKKISIIKDMDIIKEIIISKEMSKILDKMVEENQISEKFREEVFK